MMATILILSTKKPKVEGQTITERPSSSPGPNSRGPSSTQEAQSEVSAHPGKCSSSDPAFHPGSAAQKTSDVSTRSEDRRPKNLPLPLPANSAAWPQGLLLPPAPAPAPAAMEPQGEPATPRMCPQG